MGFMSILGKIFGDANEKYVKSLQPLVYEINAYENEFEKMSDEGLKNLTVELRRRLGKSRDRIPVTGSGSLENLDDILPEAFAAAREAAKRTLNKRHFDVQLIGGMVLHEGKIAEMKTGEGKTLVATLPASLNALVGRGAHVVTVNDYLARRDTVWMGEVYHFLGLTVGCINHEASYIYDPHFKEGSKEDKMRDELGSFKVVQEFLRPCNRQEAYAADITYGIRFLAIAWPKEL